MGRWMDRCCWYLHLRRKHIGERRGLDEVCRSEVLRSTTCRCPIPTRLHQPSLHYLSEGLMGSADAWKDVEQLQLLVRREVEQRDDEDGHEILPPTILREQQRSLCTTCVEVAGRTLLQLRKPGVGSTTTGNHPKTARRAAQDRPPTRRRWHRRSL